MTDICPFLTPQKMNTSRVYTDRGGAKEALSGPLSSMWQHVIGEQTAALQYLCKNFTRMPVFSFKNLPHKEAINGVNRRFFFSFQINRKRVCFCFLFYFLGHAVQYVGSYFPKQGSIPHLLHWKCAVLTTGPAGQSLVCFKQNLKPIIYK